MLVLAGVDHIITLELHSTLVQGFFSKPCDNLIGFPIFAKHISTKFQLENCIVVSKNAGGTRRYISINDPASPN
jgi:ribose-phosphate pyrophosphokinase